jgi:integrase
MGKAKFNLKNPASKDETLILLKLHLRSQALPVVISTEEKIHPKKWNKKRQRSNGRSQKAKLLNEWLDFLENTANSCYKSFLKKGIAPTTASLKTDILSKMGKNHKNDFFSFIMSVFEQQQKNGKPSAGIFRTLHNKLKAFQKRTTFDDIDFNYYHRLVTYLYDCNHKTSYINQIISKLVYVMRQAQRQNLHTNLTYQEFKPVKSNTHHITLSPAQIQALYQKQLDGEMEAARDIFICACDTGLRHQNWHSINAKNIQTIDGVQILSLTTLKSNTKIAVPVSKRVQAILNKYEGNLPVIPYHRLVPHIRTAAQLAGLTEEVEHIEYRKNKTVTHTPLYELIGTHTARRSFITNLKRQGIQDADIMKMSGHKSAAAFNKYDKETLNQNALKIAKKLEINNFLKIAK